jgi:spore coat polysaccharide biosynthesis protein SpsF
MSGPAEYAGTDIASRAPGNVAFIDLLHQRMDARGGQGSLADLLLLLERDGRFVPKTTSPLRAAPAEKPGFALIRCDGGGMLGYGHVKRTLTLAKSLREREGFIVVFALNGEPEAADLLKGAGFETIMLPRIGQTNAFVALVADHRPDILIVDANANVSRDMLTRISTQVGIIALIGDASDRRLAATHAYYPVASQSRGVSWGNAQTKVQAGFEWALLGFDPAPASAPAARHDAERPTILVSMGGSDPLELTRLVARALVKVAAPFRARFVIGPGFRGSQGLVRDIKALNPAFETVQGLHNLAKEFADADLALLSFGVIAYEAAALGVPALYLALSDDERFMGESFEAAGMGAVLGLSRELRSDDLVRPILELLQDKARRNEMRAAGLAAIDGKGGERIAAGLAQALAEQRRSNGAVITHAAVNSAS